MEAISGARYLIRPLEESTWPAFADLVERDGGVWGGCWCIGFHLDPNGPKGQCKPYRETKERLVCAGNAHAALVFEGEVCIGWCQFGSPEELPNIKHRKQYEAESNVRPDWRITCFYVGKGFRKKGVANAALVGALEEIGRLGGGVIEAYPEDVEGRKTSSSFLHGGTVKMFGRLGFKRVRRLGMHHWVVAKRVD
jgi:hypothetical protein